MQGGETKSHYFEETVRVTPGFSIIAFIVGFFALNLSEI